MTQRWAVISMVLALEGRIGVARAAAPAGLPPAAPPPSADTPIPAAEVPLAPSLPSAAAAPPVSIVTVSPPPAPEAPSMGGVGAPLAGALALVVPFVAGSALWANSTRPDLETAGMFTMAAGFAAAPWVSHGLQRRWRRAALFGSAATATSVATLVTMDIKDPFNPLIVNRKRVIFGVLLTSAMVVSIVGVFDSFVTGERP